MYVGIALGSPKWIQQESVSEPYIAATGTQQSTELDTASVQSSDAGQISGADMSSEPDAGAALTGADSEETESKDPEERTPSGATVVAHGSLYPEGFETDDIPEYSGKKYVIINDGVPYFTDEDRNKATEPFELYSALDGLGRCGTAYANACRELLPTEKRGDISEIHPTGWKQQKYDGIVDADPPYLYNRSHLIAHKLAGEDANVYNLITGTRYFNADGMSYVEDRVYDYVKSTGNHVLYRVTPVFDGNDLLARGVLMEARSVEDDKICYCEFIYNVQPGVYIDYSDGSNHKE